MDLRKNFFGTFCRDSIDGRKTLDLQSLVNTFLLFDEIILDSSSLKEIPYFIDLFGVDGLIQLLELGILKIYPQVRGAAETGQVTNDVVGNKPLLPSQHRFSYMYFTVDKDYMSRRFRNIHAKNVSKKQLKEVKLAIVDALDDRSIDSEINSLDQQLQSEFSSNRGIQAATSIALHKLFGIRARGEDFMISLNQVADNIFEADTNIGDVFDLAENDVNRVVRCSMFGLSGLHQKIEEMRIHNALSGFLKQESFILENRLEFLWESMNPEKLDSTMKRVLALKEAPPILSDEIRFVDVEKLLAVRKSPELAAFREWLADASEMEDSELLEIINDLRSKLGVRIQGKAGKSLRFLLTTGIGLIPGAGVVLGTGLGAADSFLLEEVLPYSGIVAFLDKKYPSIFDEKLNM